MSAEHDAQKRKIELRLARIQYIVAVLALIHVAAFVTGALLGFFYLLRHRFNPGGISASDTLAMILWSLGFLLALAFGLGIATIAGYALARIMDVLYRACRRALLRFKRLHHFPASGFWWTLNFGMPNRLQWRRNQEGALFAGCTFLAMFCWLIARLPFDAGMFFVTLLVPGIFISMNVFGTMVESFSPFPRRANLSALDVRMNSLSLRKRVAVITAVIVLMTTILCIGTWLDASAMLIGFREQNVSVRLTREDFEEMLAQATRSGIAVNACEQLAPGVSMLHHADILWQNMGTRSLIRFPSQPLGSDAGKRKEIRFKTGNGTIANVIDAGSQERCGEVLSDVLFADAGKRLRPSAGTRILEQLPWLNDLPAGSKIQVVAYSGKSAAADGGVADALQQADAVKQAVAALAKLPGVAINAIGMGEKNAKQECGNRSGGQRTLCEVSNRRIEIRLLDAD